jgi:hypothetical protein
LGYGLGKWPGAARVWKLFYERKLDDDQISTIKACILINAGTRNLKLGWTRGPSAAQTQTTKQRRHNEYAYMSLPAAEVLDRAVNSTPESRPYVITWGRVTTRRGWDLG